MKKREKILTVTIKDCDQQTFRVGGKGGQRRDKRDTGVRIVHRPSGAVGKSTQYRTQGENRKAAFRKMGESIEFRLWVQRMHENLPPIEEVVAEQMKDENLIVEYGPF